MIIDQYKWVTHDVPNGAIISAYASDLALQRVEWMYYSGKYGYITGYCN